MASQRSWWVLVSLRTPWPLQDAQLSDRRQFVARGEDPRLNSLCERLSDLQPGWARVARVDNQDRHVAVLGERPAGAGQVAAALQLRVQLVEDGAAHLPHLHGPEGRLDRAADESLVGLPRGHVPRRDRRVLIQQLGHGGIRLGSAAFRRFLEQPAQLDVGLLLGLGGGLEADLPLGDRIDPGVHPGAPRSARQLLNATFGDSRHTSRIGRISDIRSTNRSTSRERIRPKDPLNWEPVSGFEPLTCRLQDGCSAC